MKALVLAPMTAESLARLKELIPVTYESWIETQSLADPEELARRIEVEGISILVVEADFLTEELFQQAPGLRMVAVSRGSVAHVDLSAATSHGVPVVNTPGRNAQAVAELTIGLMLTLARRINSLNAYVKGGQWESPVQPYLELHTRGSELGGKTLGILGLGHVGIRVARLARAFDMRVLAYDPYLPASPSVGSSYAAGQNHANVASVGSALIVKAARVPGMDMPAATDESPVEADHAPLPAQLVSTVPELTGVADYISVHVPDCPDTRSLLSREMLAVIKDGCRIINTSAYGAIDEGALVKALRSGRVAGAAFDVFQTHPISPKSPLLGLDNVVLTPTWVEPPKRQ